MKVSEKAGWAMAICLACLMFFLQTGRRALRSNVILDNDETVDDLSEDGSLGKAQTEILFYDELPENDPLKNGELTLEDFKFVHIPKTGGTFIERMFRNKFKANMGYFEKNMYDLMQEQGDTKRSKILRRHRCVSWHMPTATLSLYANQTSFPWGKSYLAQPKFAVVRHPLNRIISEYNYFIAYKWGLRQLEDLCSFRSNIPPEEVCNKDVFNDVVYNMLVHVFDKKFLFHRDCHYVPQVRFLTDSRGNQHVRYVLRQEDLTSQVQDFLKNLGHDLTEEEIKKFGGYHVAPPCKVKASDLTRRTMKKIIEVFKEDFEMLNYDVPLLPAK